MSDNQSTASLDDEDLAALDAEEDALRDTVADAEAVQRYKDRLQAQYGEYGQWVAAWDITHEGALSFAKGHPVPAGLVGDEGRVVASVHRCHHPDNQRCELFNTVEAWSEPGAVVRPANFVEPANG